MPRGNHNTSLMITPSLAIDCQIFPSPVRWSMSPPFPLICRLFGWSVRDRQISISWDFELWARICQRSTQAACQTCYLYCTCYCWRLPVVSVSECQNLLRVDIRQYSSYRRSYSSSATCMHTHIIRDRMGFACSHQPNVGVGRVFDFWHQSCGESELRCHKIS